VFSVNVDASSALRHLDMVERRILDAARIGIADVAKIAYRAARETTLFKDRTGELRGTLDVVDSGAYRKRVIARSLHANYVEDGTKPHVILPKTAGGLLRFVIAGRVVFARKVNHPGTQPRPFMANAAAAGSQAMLVGLAAAVDRAVDAP